MQQTKKLLAFVVLMGGVLIGFPAVSQEEFKPTDLAVGRLPAKGTLAESLTCAALSAKKSANAKAAGAASLRERFATERDNRLRQANSQASQYSVLFNLLPGYQNAVDHMAVNTLQDIERFCRQ